MEARSVEITEATRRLLLAGREMQAEMARRLDLRLVDLQAIDQVVSSPEPIGPVELGHRLGLRSASATALVDRLVAAGHLERVADPDDRRRVALAVTTHARTGIRRELAPLLTAMGDRLDDLDERDAGVVLAFLNDTLASMTDLGHRR